jgi:hypothetical protein
MYLLKDVIEMAIKTRGGVEKLKSILAKFHNPHKSSEHFLTTMRAHQRLEFYERNKNELYGISKKNTS